MIDIVFNYIKENRLETLGTILGFIYLWYELKVNFIMWIVGIIMPAIYLVVYFQKGIYADFGMNIYYLTVSIYAFIAWKFDLKKVKHEIVISYTPKNKYWKLIACFFVCYVIIEFILKHTDSNVSYADSFTTSLSIVATWMLARKWIEQWWAWFAVDLVSSMLYIYKGLYLTSILYGFYTIMAIYGYFKWKKMMETEC